LTGANTGTLKHRTRKREPVPGHIRCVNKDLERLSDSIGRSGAPRADFDGSDIMIVAKGVLDGLNISQTVIVFKSGMAKSVSGFRHPACLM
jgi:hypothetical protein